MAGKAGKSKARKAEKRTWTEGRGLEAIKALVRGESTPMEMARKLTGHESGDEVLRTSKVLAWYSSKVRKHDPEVQRDTEGAWGEVN